MTAKIRYQVWFTKDGISQIVGRFKRRSEAETWVAIESTQMESNGGTFRIMEG